MRIALLAAAAIMAVLACADQTEVTITYPAPNAAMYGKDTVQVGCHPARFVDYVELLIDSVARGVDSLPAYKFPWDASGLAEGGRHGLQARAYVGDHQYLSDPVFVTVGYRSRLLGSGGDGTLRTFLPSGELEATVDPEGVGAVTRARFTAGCAAVVFVTDRKLYRLDAGASDAQLLYSAENGIFNCDAAPTGRTVAFESYPAATAHIFSAPDTGGTRTQLTHDGDAVAIDSSLFTSTGNSCPVFSPDGQRIAYYRSSVCLVNGDPREGEVRQDVFTMNLAGTGLANLTPQLDNGYFTGFTWTFDGQWVLFLVLDGADVAVRAANSSGRTVALPQLGGLASAIACSPSDVTLALAGTDDMLYLAGLQWNADSLWVTGSLRAASTEEAGRDIDWTRYP